MKTAQGRSIVRKYLAIHEAGHAVASHLMQLELGWQWNQFERIVVRTQDEIDEGPWTDQRGRTLNVQGIVESRDRYRSAFTKITNITIHPENERENVIAAWRKAMEADVIDELAGPVAEFRYRYRCGLVTLACGISKGVVRFTDFKHARQKISDFTQTDQETDEMFFALLERSWRLLTKNWTAVTDLADALVEQRIIGADEAIRIIEKSLPK
jgi:hypothetical protein